MIMYTVDPTKRTTGGRRLVKFALHMASSGNNVQARPATENRINAMYPLTVFTAPLSDALPLAVLYIVQCECPKGSGK